MLFNIVQVRVLSADIDNLTRAGLIAFLITMNIYNVSVMSRDALMTLFNDFWLSKTNTEQNEFVNSFRSVWKNSFTSGIMSVLSMPMIHSWIRENFEKGYNVNSYSSLTDDEIIIDDNINSMYVNLGAGGTKVIYIRGHKICFIAQETPWKNYTYEGIDYYQANNYMYLDNILLGNTYLYTPVIPLLFEVEDGNIYVTRNHAIHRINRNKWFSGVYGINEDLPENEIVNISYYAGEAVDYPMEKEVEDKYIPLPVPDVGMGIPDFDYDVGGNRVFDGTVDQFLDGALDSADYLDSTIDKLLEGGYATSKPYVNVDAGTITWPATGVTYPDTGVIDYPDVTVPVGVEEGIGETNSILQGIGSFVESIFSAPTVELDLSPLTNVNLKEKFPFCLPFDLATLITGLSSSDKDPPNIEFKFSVFHDEYTIPLNFEIFQDWAIIVNWFVLILFIVGLIMISRKLIGG